MELIRAREIVRSLAEGVDPTTGGVLVGDSVYNKPDVIRALYTVLEETTPKQVDPYQNAGKPWTEKEEEMLIDEYHAKMRMSDIAKEHGRTYGAIERRLEHLGLKKKSFWIFKKE